MALILADPAFVDIADRHRIEVVQLLAPTPDRDNKVRRFQQRKVLGYRLPRNVEVLAELAQSLTIVRVQLIEQFPAARIAERLEHLVH